MNLARKSVSNKIAYALTCVALVGSVGSIVAAQTYNWVPLGTVGSTWSSNGSHAYNTNVGSVVIGGTLPDGGLLLDVAGPVGASQFCDASGTNCFTSTQINWSVPNGSGHMYNTNSGRIGINQTSPTQQLHVGGNVLANSFLYSSDRRLKHNIEPLSGLGIITQLEGVSFKWNSDGSQTLGLIAQDVEEVVPELVVTDPESGMKSVRYANVVAPLIEAIKEQQAMIDDLQQQINDLK